MNERHATEQGVVSASARAVARGLFRQQPFHLLEKALVASVFAHAMVFVAVGSIFDGRQGGVVPVPELQVRIISAYRPDPVPVSGTVTTNATDALSSARFVSPAMDNSVSVPRLVALPLQQAGEKSRGDHADEGGGNDCRVIGFNFCSSL